MTMTTGTFKQQPVPEKAPRGPERSMRAHRIMALSMTGTPIDSAAWLVDAFEAFEKNILALTERVTKLEAAQGYQQPGVEKR